MTVPTIHELGQLRHVDLLAMAIEAGAAPEGIALRLASQSRDQVLAVLRRPEVAARLAGRSGRRLEP